VDTRSSDSRSSVKHRRDFLWENFYFQRDPHFDHNHIGWSGHVVGIGLPIRVPFVIVHYEVKAYFHQAINGDLSLTTSTAPTRSTSVRQSHWKYTPGFCAPAGDWVRQRHHHQDRRCGIKGIGTHYFWYADYGLAIRIAYCREIPVFLGPFDQLRARVAPNEDTKQRMNIRIIVGYERRGRGTPRHT